MVSCFDTHTGTLVHTSKHKIDTFNESKENETKGKKREEKKKKPWE